MSVSKRATEPASEKEDAVYLHIIEVLTTEWKKMKQTGLEQQKKKINTETS